MPIPADQRRSYLARQVGTLELSRVGHPNPMALVRAASWHNSLLRLGVPLPLFIVHDLGLLLTGQGTAQRRADDSPGMKSYSALLAQLAECELMQVAASARVRDELVAVLLTKLLRDLQQRWPARQAWVGSAELPLDPGLYLNSDVTMHYRDFDMSPVHSLLSHILQHQLFLLTAVEQIDLDTLRLLGMFDSKRMDGVVDLADLLNVFSSPEANGVANFSMDLLPSVLETKRQTGVQTFSVDGYASVERQGSVDSIVLTEFAYDDEMFEQKVVDNELFYYGHEKQRVDETRLQYLLVDSSASMRGEREVFARGLALTLSKTLSLQGAEVWLRFFDSRLYETMRMGSGGEAAVPYLLCFRSERGRNYGRVFRQLLGELRRHERQDGRQVVLYIITHGQCHIGVDLVEQLTQVAQIYGVFILPSSTLHLDYLPLLNRYQIVEAESLSSRELAADRALEIVGDATEEEGPHTTASGASQVRMRAYRSEGTA
ncbi:MAG: hypothetical protein KC503_30220 [Myxococcales bacterium]|nr:hypothetical protein [Myxococcales bacterium]